MSSDDLIYAPPPPPATRGGAGAGAQALDAVDTLRQGLGGNLSPGAPAREPVPYPSGGESPDRTAGKPPATESLARRTGALIDEVNFPGFVAGLVHGTFDAIVDASIRQMESFSSLVSAVAKSVEQFTEENVTPNQARDYLAQQYPQDVGLLLPTPESPEPRLQPRAEGRTPPWLRDFGLEGEELTGELLEQTLIPMVRSRIGGERQQLLATMVMLGMNRVAVKDGSISAKVMFRAAASDAATVSYAVNSDPARSGSSWGERGGSYGSVSTMVSTVGVNAQSESALTANLYGEVKLNFVSETLPLEKLADAAKLALVQRHAPALRTAPAEHDAKKPGGA